MATRKTSRSTTSRGNRTPSPRQSRRRRKGVNVLLREVDPEIIDVLKARAERNGRSLQQELHLTLRREAKLNFEEARAMVEAWQARFAGRTFPSSEDLIREDRDR